jgi:elongation factor P hydroxylase
MSAGHNYQDIITLFNQTFLPSENTLLVKGNDEPIYLPANVARPHHQVVFAHGYYASALHEISHWCIAGKARPLLEDYGYWYCPDGRNAEQQTEFEQVEVKPQALEWAFSVAANKAFRVSTDNLNGAPVDTLGFTRKVHQQVLEYLDAGFPPRAQTMIQILRAFYRQPELQASQFNYEDDTFYAV